MPRKYVRKTVSKYSYTQLNEAVQRVKNGETYYKVSKETNIPMETIRRNVKYTTQRFGSGGITVLTNDEERLIVDTLKYLSQCGFPMDREDLKTLVFTFLNSKGEQRFKGNMPGNEWIRGFKERWNKELSCRKPELLTKARIEGLSEGVLCDFFEMYEKVISDNNLQNSPERLFNLDETGLNTDPRHKGVFVDKKLRSAYLNASSCGKAMYSVLFCCSAAGQFLPPLVIYKGLHLYDTWTVGGPPDALYAVSPSGYMQDFVFEKWILHFVECVKDVEKPVLLIMDGHGSHLTFESARACQKNQIILLCLPPNTSHALQPLDVGVFGQVKHAWKEVLKKWSRESRLQSVSKPVFPTLLKQICSQLKAEWAISAFKGSGLYPVAKEAVAHRVIKPQVVNSEDLNSSAIQTAVSAVLSPIICQENKQAKIASQKRRKRVQHKTGEILTHSESMTRMQTEENKVQKKRKLENANENKTSSNKKYAIKKKDCEKQKFKVIEIPGYGDCLFASVAKFVFESYADNITQAVRKVAVEHICNNWHEFSEACVVHKTYDVNAYRQHMSKKGVYGDNPEIAALSKVYGVCIEVLVGDEFLKHNDSTYNEENSKNGHIFLHYNPKSKHYNLLQESKQTVLLSNDDDTENIENFKVGMWVAVQYDNAW